MRTSYKYFNLYLFLIVFFFIAFLAGFFYYKNDYADGVGSSIDIISTLNNNNSNILNDCKNSLIILFSSFSVLLLPFSFFKIFYYVFSVGFIFHFLFSYGFVFSFLFITFYYLIPFLFLLVLFRVGVCISKNLVLHIMRKPKDAYIKKYIKKFILLFCFLIIYDLIVLVFSGLFNSFLLKLLR